MQENNREVSTNKEEPKKLDELYAALAKAQAEFKPAKKNKVNPFFRSKYADYESVVNSTRPALTKYGLAVIQRPDITEKGQVLYTMLCHSSGQVIEGVRLLNPPKNDIQSIGSYTTYIKRYDYSAMTGAITGDDDDDGEAAMQRKESEKSEYISKAQLTLLSKEINGNTELVNSILKGYKIDKLSEVKKGDFSRVYERVKNINKKKGE